MGIVATLSMITVQTANAQVPDACGETQENACVVRSEEDAEELLEEFPDAIVEVDAEKYDNLETEANDIDDMNTRDEDEDEDEEDNENEGDSGDSGSSSQDKHHSNKITSNQYHQDNKTYHQHNRAEQV